MLQKQYRLPGAVRLISPSSYTSPTFFVKISKNELGYSRFGFVVRKTVDKRATVRNRVKRVFRSCIEEMQPDIKTGFDILFLLKNRALEIRRVDMYNELQLFLKEKQLLQ